MNILRVIPTVDPRYGGPVEGIRRIHAFLPALGVSEHVVTLDRPGAGYLKDFPIPVTPKGPADGMFRRLLGRTPLLRYGYSPGFVGWLKANAPRFDAVVVHGLWNYATHGASLALRGARTPYLVYAHGMLDPWFKQAYPLKHHAKQLCWSLFEGPLLAGAGAVLFTTEEERLVSRGVFNGHPYAERVVRYGTSGPPDKPDDPVTQTQAFETAFPALKGKRFLLYLSRIHPKKGCDLLIRAFAKFASDAPDLDLVMAGPDQIGWAADLQTMAKELGVSGRVHWTGMLTGDAKWGAFRAAEAFVLPSHQENFGIVVAEALACGCPALISNKVNIWREVAAAGAGLVDDDTDEGAARLLGGWLVLPKDMRGAMRAKARQCFLDNFDARHAAEDFARALQALRG